MKKEEFDITNHRLKKLLNVMAKLRDPETGCPWDLQQTHASIAAYTIEEAYEVADALENGDTQQIKEELGDLLFQVVFHAQISSEKNGFNFGDIADVVAKKMIERHPHVFSTSSDVANDGLSAQWEELKEKERIKAAEKQGAEISALDGVALAFPSLMRAQKIQKRAAKQGFDWTDLTPVIEKVHEELQELEIEIEAKNQSARIADELGDLLFASVNLARHLKIDAETALKRATKRFERRFRYIEDNLRDRGKNFKDVGLEEMEELWLRAKSTE